MRFKKLWPLLFVALAAAFCLSLLSGAAFAQPVPAMQQSYVASLGGDIPSLEEMVLGQGMAQQLTSGAQTIRGAKTYSSTITSTVASGSNAIVLATGARLKLGGGTTDYLTSNGTTTITAAGSFVGTGNVSSGANLFTGGGDAAVSGIAAGLRVYGNLAGSSTGFALKVGNANAIGLTGTIAGFYLDGFSTLKAQIWGDGSWRQGTSPTLQTCAAGTEGTLTRQAGASTGTRTFFCICTSDGGGTPAYAWARMDNIASVGTATTCP